MKIPQSLKGSFRNDMLDLNVISTEGSMSDEKSYELELLIRIIVAHNEIWQSPKRAHFRNDSLTLFYKPKCHFDGGRGMSDEKSHEL
jgi:hypothetical protein